MAAPRVRIRFLVTVYCLLICPWPLVPPPVTVWNGGSDPLPFPPVFHLCFLLFLVLNYKFRWKVVPPLPLLVHQDLALEQPNLVPLV